MGWIINGKEVSNEEHAEHVKRQEAEKQRTEDEIQRRISEVGEAYRECTEFIEQHPEVHYEMKNAQMREHDLYRKLRQNLERAGSAPRCEKVREDGTVCGSPQMKGYKYCYAHERMLEMRSGRLELPAPEDANSIQMAIMRVQKALIDDEISEKKAGLLLYSLQMASSNLKHTTFTDSKKAVVTEMPVSLTASGAQNPGSATSRVIGQSLPLINAHRRNCQNSRNRKPRLKPLPQRTQRNTEAKASHSRGLLHPNRPKPGLPGTPGLCHTSIEWDRGCKSFRSWDDGGRAAGLGI